jgi:hypothetical protein
MRKALREKCPRESQAVWKPPPRRRTATSALPITSASAPRTITAAPSRTASPTAPG